MLRNFHSEREKWVISVQIKRKEVKKMGLFDGELKNAKKKREKELSPKEYLEQERKERQKGLRKIEEKYGIKIEKGYGSKKDYF